MPPKVHPSCFVHESAVVVGDVEVGPDCGIWPNAVVRGDENSIRIGEGSNVQDCCVIHCSAGHPVSIGRNVSLGHGSVVHGAAIGDDVIVGMSATVMNGSEVGPGSMIAAGALVKEGTKVPPGSLVVGLPGKVVREGDASLRQQALLNARTYVELARKHKAGGYGRHRA